MLVPAGPDAGRHRGRRRRDSTAYSWCELGLPPFIVTFSMFFLLRGRPSSSRRVRSAGRHLALYDFYTASIGRGAGRPLPLWRRWIRGVVVVLRRTSFGRHVYGAGGDPRASALAGVNVGRTQVLTYIVSALLATLAALYIVGRNGVGDPRMGDGLELDSITAVVLGGTSLFGGRGSIIGTLGGVLVLIVVGNMFNILQIDVFYQQLIKGVVLVGAVAALKARA